MIIKKFEYTRWRTDRMSKNSNVLKILIRYFFRSLINDFAVNLSLWTKTTEKNSLLVNWGIHLKNTFEERRRIKTGN